MKLYHYVHCPFCVRIRMVLGFLSYKYESIVLSYDNEETPIQLTGTKMLPIFDFGTNIINESLDIIKGLDKKNTLKDQRYYESQKAIDSLLSLIGKDVHSLAMPYWMWTPEFNDSSRSYFQNKKGKKRGPFKDLVQNADIYKSNIADTLAALERNLTPFYKTDSMTLVDILIASHLWGLYIVPEFQFSDKLNSYLQKIKQNCYFNYHEDFWN